MVYRTTVFMLALCLSIPVWSGEGMWLPIHLDSLNHKDMKEKGLMLDAVEIFSNTHPSLKDAIVMFGNGCTGELISAEGLIVTNYHCGYSRIQSHSTVENNLLADGFWAQANPEELPNPGLTATFLVHMERVTGSVLTGIPDSLNETDRNNLINQRIEVIRKEAVSDTFLHAEIKPFYFGREYYLFVYETYPDVRLVGAPAETIGRFGGDEDNWMWPRHTGDFALFRIYADKNNRPADYSQDNVPFTPRKYLNISLGGVQEGDYTMVMGYPGRTDQYLTSDALEMITGKSLPAKIAIRTVRRNALETVMEQSPELRLKYISKYVSLSNSWKKWIGVVKGIRQSHALEAKIRQEEDFRNWAGKLTSDPACYASLLGDFSIIYDELEPMFLAGDLGAEILNSLETSRIVNDVHDRFFATMDSSKSAKLSAIGNIKSQGNAFFRTEAVAIDRNTLPGMLEVYMKYTDSIYHPAFKRQIADDFHGNYAAFIESVFDESIFTDSVKYRKAFSMSESKIRKKIMNDPLISIYRDFSELLVPIIYGRLDSMNRKLNGMYRRYVSGLMEMKAGKTCYPDANFTMRLTYGKVEGYEPADAVNYSYYTTFDGILEKEKLEIADYKVPEDFKTERTDSIPASYLTDGRVPVCFIASNHTSGGNSGSPVLNAKGDLIGINFDRNWEGTMSDYAYNPDICRNISLDVRYMLFVIDQVANADWILNELTLTNQ
ncbi:MAG: S46 family peptidase [Bacteroidales bacterium]|nr:S46 family peptidase [Bacteroidales bacterium]